MRGKGRFLITEYVASDEKVTRRFPLLLTTGRILSQYNVGAQTRRTGNQQWHDEDRLDLHPDDAQERGIREGDWVGILSRAGQTVLRARVTRKMQPGVVYTTFHHPESGANVITTDSSDWATNCPEYKVTAVQVTRLPGREALAAAEMVSHAESRLVWMANRIGQFYAAQPDRAEALVSIASHIEKFWEPRMRRQFAEHLAGGGEGVLPLVREAWREGGFDFAQPTPTPVP
jgi:predicted molibdopterin-dependent oxidoreductase YjgC